MKTVLLSVATLLATIVFRNSPPVAAQSPSATASVEGAWAGWLDVAGNYQPMTVSLAPSETPPGTITNLLSGASRPLGAVVVEGSRVRISLADPRFPVLTGVVEGDAISGLAEATGGRTGTFRLIRTASLDVTAKRRYVGAYRFPDGRYLLMDLGYPPGSDMLYAVDAQTGIARAMYPISPTEFRSGPALLVPEPTEETFYFDTAGDRITSVVRQSPGRAAERAVRIEVREEEVRFRNGDVTLAGTLLLPATGGRAAGLVFAHGGGAAVREQFWGFGYLMAARGFAVLAFDKRGTGGSSGNWRGSTFEALADDVIAGARFLRSRSDVDGRRIGFWGLSQGAWIAPIAAVRSGDAAFVITLSGGGLTPAQGELLDSEYEMRKAGMPEQDVLEGLAFQRARDEFMRTGSDWTDYAARLQRAQTRPWWRLPFTDLSGPASAVDPFWSNTKPFYFYDPIPTLQRLRAPMLAIFGEFDTPEGVKANVAGITGALERAKHPDFTIRVFPNGRHNLMDIGGFAPNEYARLQRFVPELFETMASWLERRVMPPSK